MPVPTYRVPIYSTTSYTSTRGNMMHDGVYVEFTEGPNTRFPIQPNVSNACTTWKTISSVDKIHHIFIYMSLVGLSYEQFLKLNPDVPREQLVTSQGMPGTGLTPFVNYCWGTWAWEGSFVTYKVSLVEFNAGSSSLA